MGHKISTTGLEVDRAKVYVIETLMLPNTVKGIKSFLGHAGFYRRFIKTSQKFSVHYPNCLRRMPSLNLITLTYLHLKR